MTKEQLIKIIKDQTSTPSWMPSIIEAIDEYTESVTEAICNRKVKSNENVIRNIESLFPIDSCFEDTNAIGELLLRQAKNNLNYTDNWRLLPENVLREYERLCINEEMRQAHINLKHH